MNNVEIVQELYRAFAAKDEPRLREILAPDIEWIQCEGFPGGGRREGREEVFEKVFSGLRREWDDWKVEIDEYIDGGRSVVVLGFYGGRHSQTGREMRVIFAHVYELDGGQIVRFRQITDTAPMVEAARDA